MKPNKAEQQALITLMHRMYEEIRGVELQWDLHIDPGDMRPRIEYFHDAIRALTSGTNAKRLSVEHLAYDLGMLRHTQANPFLRPKGMKVTGAPGMEVALQTPYASGAKADAATKTRLADMYKSYAVLFAALLADTADRDYQSRLNEANTEVEDIAMLEQAVKAAQKKEPEIDIVAMAEQYISDPDLLNKILMQVHTNKQRKKMQAHEAQKKLKDMMSGSEKIAKAIEQAHFTYATSQLAIFELAKDVVKKMAIQGMNIVGNFVQSAINEVAGRGQRGM